MTVFLTLEFLIEKICLAFLDFRPSMLFIPSQVCFMVVRLALKNSTKISGTFGLKLNGPVRSTRKRFQKTGPPFEVDCFSRLDRFDRKFTVPFNHSASTKMSGNFGPKLNGSVRYLTDPWRQIRSLRGIKQDRSKEVPFHSPTQNFETSERNFCSMDRALSQYKIFNISKSTATNCWVVPDLPIVDLDQYNNL